MTDAAAQGSSGGSNTALLVLLAVACLTLLAFAVYFLVVQPRRRRVPLLQALPLLSSDEREDLERAERLLSQAVTAGLRKHDLAEARFALGFVRGLLGRHDKAKYQEAATAIAELKASTGHDPDSAYLDLWLQARLENHDNVCELYEAYGGEFGDRLQTKLIVSISYLHKAAEHWRRREVEGALHYFDLVRDLGALRSQIPGQVNDLQIVHGIQAVFDDRLDDARRSFAGARTRAEDRKEPPVEADLGLVVCKWKTGYITGIDADLEAIVRELDARAETFERPEAGEEDRKPASNDQVAKAEREEEELLRSHVGLLFVVSLLMGWLVRLPANAGLPSEEFEEFRRRIERVRDADPELGDALLIVGLTEYYFASAEAERSRAVGVLVEGTGKAKGIDLPEVLDLIERERRLFEAERDALGRYLALVRGYLTDDGVPLELRAELKRRLEAYARYSELGAIDLTAEEHSAAPSVDDIRHRGSLLRQRVDRLVTPRLRGPGQGDGATDLRRLLASLEDATKVVSAGVEHLQNAERDLMLRTGEFLLPEDPIPDEDVAVSDG